MNDFIKIIYIISVIMFILGFKKMSSPKTAIFGIKLSGIGMVFSIFITLFHYWNYNLIFALIVMIVGIYISWLSAKKYSITHIPEMIALYNGMGSGAASIIAGIELFKFSRSLNSVDYFVILSLYGAIIGNISFIGSIVAFLKLHGNIKNIHYAMLKLIGILTIIIILITTTIFLFTKSSLFLSLIFVLSLIYGILMTISINNSDIPIIISLYNAFTGLAVACEGAILNNIVMIIAGAIVGSAGSFLTKNMAKVINKSLYSILFKNYETNEISVHSGATKSIDILDVATMISYVNKIILVPGYGMAIAQAQHKMWELASFLLEKKINVRFAIHPVAGRMPGHMNVLLAEAGVPYEYIVDMENINDEFINTDIVIVLGANDIINASARNDKSSPIYGMEILNVDYAKQVIVIKRGNGKGYSGIENSLFIKDNCFMLYGDAKQVITEIIQIMKKQ